MRCEVLGTKVPGVVRSLGTAEYKNAGLCDRDGNEHRWRQVIIFRFPVAKTTALTQYHDVKTISLPV
jgi:hypothetical protein